MQATYSSETSGSFITLCGVAFTTTVCINIWHYKLRKWSFFHGVNARHPQSSTRCPFAVQVIPIVICVTHSAVDITPSVEGVIPTAVLVTRLVLHQPLNLPLELPATQCYVVTDTLEIRKHHLTLSMVKPWTERWKRYTDFQAKCASTWHRVNGSTLSALCSILSHCAAYCHTIMCVFICSSCYVLTFMQIGLCSSCAHHSLTPHHSTTVCCSTSLTTSPALITPHHTTRTCVSPWAIRIIRKIQQCGWRLA